MNKIKVLVLDSDFMAAESAASIFRADGIKVFRASDGQTALEMFLMERPDAIVVSALPREPNDFDICAAVAKDAYPVPVIVLIGPDEEEAFRKGRPRPSGVAAFLVKPFLPGNLRAALRRVLAPPEKKEADEELDRVLNVLNPAKSGSAKAPVPPQQVSSKPIPPPAPVVAQAPAPPIASKPAPPPAPIMVQVPAPPVSSKPTPTPSPVVAQVPVPPVSFKQTPPPVPVVVQAPAKHHQESVDSLLADVLADVGIEKKQKKTAFSSGETISRSGDRNMRLETAQADPFLPEAPGPKPIKLEPNRPKPPAVVPALIPVPAVVPAPVATPVPAPVLSSVSPVIPPLVPQKQRPAVMKDSFVAIPEDLKKPSEFEEPALSADNTFGGIYEEPKKKAGIKLLAFAGGLILVASILVFGVFGKKSPAPILSERTPAVSDVIPASQENEVTVPDTTVPESNLGEIEKKLPAPLPKPGPKDTPVVATKPPAAAVKPTTPDQGANRNLQAQETNPIPTMPVETTPPPVVAPIKVDPAVSKAVNLDQIPGLGLQTREVNSVPTKPTETTPPPVKATPPAVTVGQLVPLNQVDVLPQLTKSVTAIYPPMMMQRKIEGQLQFSILISENGDVLKAERIQAANDNPGFESAARTALLKRKYKPASKGGVPVQVWMLVNVSFKLNR